MTDTATPRDWYHLIVDAEDFRRRHGYGLADVWAHIDRADYTPARTLLDTYIAEAAKGLIPLRRAGHFRPVTREAHRLKTAALGSESLL